jgi:hypothetical protein
MLLWLHKPPRTYKLPVLGTKLETLRSPATGKGALMLNGFTCDNFFFYVLCFTSIVLLNCGLYFIASLMSPVYYLCARW